jgi:hypothetical protein
MLPVESLKFVTIAFKFYNFVLTSALVTKKEVAFKISSLTLSQSLKVLMKLNIVFLKYSPVPIRSSFLKASTNFSLGVLLKVL